MSYKVDLSSDDDYESNPDYGTYGEALKFANDEMATKKWTEAKIIEEIEVAKLTRKIKVQVY